MLRNERLGKKLYVPLPDEVARLEILQTICRKLNVSPTIDLQSIAKQCKRFSGADLAALVREAGVEAVSRCDFNEENPNVQVIITPEDFEKALRKTAPSVSEEDETKYLQLKQQFQLYNQE